MNDVSLGTGLARIAPIILAVVLGLSGCDDDLFSSDQEVAQEGFSFDVEVTTQTRLQLNAINGNITITGTSNSDSVFITGVREVRSDTFEDAEANLENLQVDVDVRETVIRVTTIQPEDPDGRTYVVNYEITVPADLLEVIRNANGNVTLESIDADVDITNANGNITLTDIAGSALVDLGNGQVDGRVTLPSGGTIDIAIGNGGIELAIPQSTSAQFAAAVGNGAVTVSNLTLEDMVASTKSVVGRLGSGDGEIVLTVGNGAITVVGF